MANSTSNIDAISVSQASKEVTANSFFDAASQAATYGRRASTSSGLTWGYYGGNVVVTAGTTSQISNGTLTLTASSTNYIVAAKADGSVSVATTTTNWNNAADYWRLYSVVVGTSTVTSYTDVRAIGQYTAAGAAGTGVVESIVAGTGVTVDDTDPANPVISVTSGGGSGVVESIVAGTGVAVDNTDPANPVVTATASAPTQAIPIACSDETTAITAGTSKVTFRMPFAFTLSAVRASLTTAQASGSTVTVDINEGGTSILSTKLTIDNTEKTSTTAAAAAVISDANLADDAEITIDVDQVGDGTAKGLKVYLIGVAA